MAGEKTYSGGEATGWIQVGGPGTDYELLGSCYSIGDLAKPMGDTTALVCRNQKIPMSYEVRKKLKGTPGQGTGSISAPLYRLNNLIPYLAKLGCPFNTQIHYSECDDGTVFTAWELVKILYNVILTNPSETAPLVGREAPSDDVIESSDLTFDKWEFVYEATVAAQVNAVGVTGVPVTGVAYCDVPQCYSSCGAYTPGCQAWWATMQSDLASGPVVQYTLDRGANWQLPVVQPRIATDGPGIAPAVGLHAFAPICNTDRTIVFQGQTWAANIPIAEYTDDNGATAWNVVTPAGAVAAEFFTASYMHDTAHIWVASNLGWVYFSDDFGLTYAQQVTPAGIAVTVINDIRFYNDQIGAIVGAGNAINITLDGGNTWATPANTPGAAALNCVSFVNQDYMLVGDAAGVLYASFDRGATPWVAVGHAGAGVGAIMDIDFYDDQIGVMVRETAAALGSIHRTIDGGNTWIAQATPVNIGIDAVRTCDPNFAIMGGTIAGPLPFLAGMSAQ